MKLFYYLLIIICLFIPTAGSSQQLLASLDNSNALREIPVICFHHIRKNVLRPNELTMSADAFRADMKALFDSGYHSISPSELLEYYTIGKPLPPKPFMITFDDGNADQWEN